MLNENPRAKRLEQFRHPQSGDMPALADVDSKLSEYHARFPEADVHYDADENGIVAIAPFRFKDWSAYAAFKKAGSPAPVTYIPQ